MHNNLQILFTDSAFKTKDLHICRNINHLTTLGHLHISINKIKETRGIYIHNGFLVSKQVFIHRLYTAVPIMCENKQ